MTALAADLGVAVIAVDAPEYGAGARHVPDLEAAEAALVDEGELGPDVAVLVKASRVAGLERLAVRLLEG